MAVSHYDLVIVGGGAVGLSLLWRLSNTKNLKILVLESRMDSNFKLSDTALANQDRFIVLSDSSRRFYQQVGCWEAIESHSTLISSIQLSVKGQYGTSLLKANQVDVPALGYVISLYQLENILEQACEPLANSLVRGARLVECVHKDCWEITYTQNSVNHHITAECLIGADGQDSIVRIQNKIELSTKEYGHQAIIGTVKVQVARMNAFERFLSKGAIAFLPLKNDRAVFIWTLPDEEALAFSKKSDLDFLNLLQTEFGYRVGKLTDLQARKRFPLTMTQATCQGKPDKKLLLMGAAALNLHPIGAQGLNLSLRTIQGLIQLIRDQKEGPLDFQNIIERYLETIRLDQYQTRWMTDALASYVSGGPFPLPLRGLGLMIFDSIPLLKRMFTKMSTGLGVF